MKESSTILIEPIRHKFVLGSWIVSPELNCLSEDGQPAGKCLLEPRLMHLLCFLAANPGRVLTRDQLTEELWPKVIVNENSLTRAVSELRKKLNSGKNSNNGYLETIPKKGYCLTPGILGKAESEIQPRFIKAGKPNKCDSINPLKAWQPVLTAASFALAVALASGPFAMSADNPALDNQNPVIADQVIGAKVNYGGAKISLSKTFSPDSGYSPFRDQIPSIAPPLVSKDGKTLAYIRYDDNISTIFLSSLESIETPLAVFSSNKNMYNLSWSPLGDALLFASQPMAVTTLLMEQTVKTASLLMLDLETLEIKVLIDRVPERQENRISREI